MPKISILFTLFFQINRIESKKIIILISFLLTCVNSVYGQRLVKYLETGIIYTNRTIDVTDMHYYVPIPQNIPGKQEVLSIEYKLIKPQKISNKEDDSYAYFALDRPKSLEKIEIEVVLLLKENDLVNAIKNKKTPEKIKPKKYLKHQVNFQVKNKKIKEIVNNIVENTDEEIARNIYQYVIGALEYKSFEHQNRGAIKALKTGEGDCTEYSELMVTLCRAKGIPARIVEGLVVSTAKNPLHNWAEIYLKDYGWVSVDPTHGDHENAITTFENLQNKYIYFNYSRFDGNGLTWTMNKGISSKKAVSLNSKFSFEDLGHTYLTKAIDLYQSESFNEAIQLIEEVLETGARDVSYFVLRGFLLTKLGHKEKGLANLQIAMKLAVNQGDEKFVNLAFINYFNLIGNEDKAEKILQKTFSENRTISEKGVYIWEELKKSNPSMINRVFAK